MSLRLNLTKTPVQLFSKQLVHIKYIQYIQIDLIKCKANTLEQKIEYLNHTYIIHLVASWQTFIEQLVKFGFEKICTNNLNFQLKEIARARVNDALTRFRNPNSEMIDKLFYEALNIKKISNNWHWKDMTRDKAIQIVNKLLNIRHQIAHTGKTSSHLSLESNFDIMKNIFHIACITEETLLQQLTTDYNRLDDHARAE